MTYSEGTERLQKITIDRRPAESIPPQFGLWSEGEFSPLILTVLQQANRPQLSFRGEETLEGTPALVSNYRISQYDNSGWGWRLDEKVFRPGFHGSIWIEKTTGRLLRLTREARAALQEIDSWLPYVAVASDTWYGEVEVSGLGKFFLPVRSQLVSCARGIRICNRNVLTFRNCRKFAGKARIITDAPQP